MHVSSYCWCPHFFYKKKQVIAPLGEQVALVAHYCWYFSMAYLVSRDAGDPVTSAVFFAVFVGLSNVLTGLFLVSLGVHNKK
jgi:hypothetical protein